MDAIAVGNSHIVSFKHCIEARGLEVKSFIKVDDKVGELRLVGERGGVSDLRAVPRREIMNLRPLVALLQYGGNELAKGWGAWKTAQSVVRFARELRSLGVRVVGVMSVLPREENMVISKVRYENEAHQFRRCVRGLVLPSENIFVHPHKGFSYYLDDEGIQRPRPMTEWSWDGIHANKPFGRELYARSLKNAMNRALSML